jgi:hypothetical protein
MAVTNSISLFIDNPSKHIFVIFNDVMVITSLIIVIEDAIALLLPLKYINDIIQLQRFYTLTKGLLVQIQFIMFIDIWIQEPNKTVPFYLEFWNSSQTDDLSTIIVKVSSLIFPFMILYNFIQLIFMDKTPSISTTPSIDNQFV